MQKVLVYIAVACPLVAQTPVRNPIFSGSIASGTGPVHLTTGTPSVGAINLATEITGTLPAASLPTPTASTLGGVRSIICSGTDKISSIATTGIPACTTDSGVGGGASIQTDLADIKVTTNGTTTITVPAGLMPRGAQTICPDYGGGNIVMSSGTATVFMSVANDCTVQATSTATFGTPTGITTAVGSAFPANHFPLAHCAYAGTGPTISCIDDRRAFSFMPILAGANVSVTPSAAGYTIAAAASAGGDIAFPMGGCNTVAAGAYPAWGVFGTGITPFCDGQGNTLLDYAFTNTSTGFIAHYTKLPRTFSGPSATVSAVLSVFQIDSVAPTNVARFVVYFNCSTPGTTLLQNLLTSGTTVEFNIPAQNTNAEISFPGMAVPANCTSGAFIGVGVQRDQTTTGTNFPFEVRVIGLQLRYD